MYDPNNPPEIPENVNTDYIKRALFSTLEPYPHFTINPQTLSSLDIVPKLKSDGLPDSSGNLSSRSNTTVYAVLNKCRTLSGQRLLSLWLQNPLRSKEHIDRRLEIVKHFSDNAELRTICHDDFLRKVPDLLRVACKIAKEKCTILDLVKIYRTCKTGESLFKSYQRIVNMSNQPCESVKKLFIWIQQSCENLKDYSELLENSLLLDRPDENNDYLLKPNSNDDIAKITDELDTLVKKARREMRDVAHDVNLEVDKTIKLEIDADKGFGLRVTKQNEQAIRGNSKYQQASQVKKDGYRFTTKALTKFSNGYIEAKAEYDRVAKNVYREVISSAVMYDEQVLELCMAFTVLDVFVSLSLAAIQNNYTCPLILESDDGKIQMEKLRHPCIENQPDIENFVANDISMDKFEKKFYIMTGPNMGGKSTFIKSIAIAVIMAQCGSMIPAEESRISIVDSVFTRVGAGDRQAEGISTFIAEMTDMSTIIEGATERSLVIIDELGRGTSTFDGFGLAWSLTKHLSTVTKCFGIFATHFHELTELEDEVPTVGNLHVKAYCHEDKLTMLYNIDKGVCDESYGINVARYTKFPKHVVMSAEEKLKQFEEVPGFTDKGEVRKFIQSCLPDVMANQSN